MLGTSHHGIFQDWGWGLLTAALLLNHLRPLLGRNLEGAHIWNVLEVLTVFDKGTQIKPRRRYEKPWMLDALFDPKE